MNRPLTVSFFILLTPFLILTSNPCSYRIVNVTSRCATNHLMKNIVATELHYEKEGSCAGANNPIVSIELYVGSNVPTVAQFMATTPPVPHFVTNHTPIARENHSSRVPSLFAVMNYLDHEKSWNESSHECGGCWQTTLLDIAVRGTAPLCSSQQLGCGNVTAPQAPVSISVTSIQPELLAIDIETKEIPSYFNVFISQDQAPKYYFNVSTELSWTGLDFNASDFTFHMLVRTSTFNVSLFDSGSTLEQGKSNLNRFRLFIDATGYLRAAYGPETRNNCSSFTNGSVEVCGTKSALNVGQWHHVAVVLAPTSITLFVDGKIVGAYLGGKNERLNVFVSHSQASYLGNNFIGGVAAIKIDSVAKTPVEIEESHKSITTCGAKSNFSLVAKCHMFNLNETIFGANWTIVRGGLHAIVNVTKVTTQPSTLSTLYLPSGLAKTGYTAEVRACTTFGCGPSRIASNVPPCLPPHTYLKDGRCWQCKTGMFTLVVNAKEEECRPWTVLDQHQHIEDNIGYTSGVTRLRASTVHVETLSLGSPIVVVAKRQHVGNVTFQHISQAQRFAGRLMSNYSSLTVRHGIKSATSCWDMSPFHCNNTIFMKDEMNHLEACLQKCSKVSNELCSHVSFNIFTSRCSFWNSCLDNNGTLTIPQNRTTDQCWRVDDDAVSNDEDYKWITDVSCTSPRKPKCTVTRVNVSVSKDCGNANVKPHFVLNVNNLISTCKALDFVHVLPVSYSDFSIITHNHFASQYTLSDEGLYNTKYVRSLPSDSDFTPLEEQVQRPIITWRMDKINQIQLKSNAFSNFTTTSGTIVALGSVGSQNSTFDGSFERINVKNMNDSAVEQQQQNGGGGGGGGINFSFTTDVIGFPTGSTTGISAQSFDDTLTKISVPWHPTLNPTGMFTVSLWAKTHNISGVHSLIHSATNENKNECLGYLLATNENKFVFSLAFSNTGYPGNMINLEGGAAEINKWTYLVMSYNSDTRKMKLAVDGYVYEKQVNGETEQIHSDLKYVPNLNRYNHTILNGNRNGDHTFSDDTVHVQVLDAEQWQNIGVGGRIVQDGPVPLLKSPPYYETIDNKKVYRHKTYNLAGGTGTYGNNAMGTSHGRGRLDR